MVKYSSGFYYKDDSVTSFLGDPNALQKELEASMKLRLRSEGLDPEGPPRRERGDIYIILGALVGMIIGGVLAAVISYHYLGFVGIFLITGGCAIGGGIIGATIGNFIKKWRYKVREKKYSDSTRYQG